MLPRNFRVGEDAHSKIYKLQKSISNVKFRTQLSRALLSTNKNNVFLDQSAGRQLIFWGPAREQTRISAGFK